MSNDANNGHWGNTKKRLEPFLNMKPDTLAIHGGQYPDPTTGAVMPPVFLTSTYAQKEPAKPIGEFEYSRTHNPTRRMLEDCVALLEGGTYGFATSTGMTAIALLVSLLKSGDEIICCDDVYGGTYRYFSKILPNSGIKAHFVDFSDLSKVEVLINSNTKLIWVETPTNPLLRLIDIKAVSTLCKKNNILLAVDNTFMSSIFQQPLKLGADVVMHSMTKYMNGHSDVVAGCLVIKDDVLAKQLYFNQNSLGYVAGAFDSWLVMRGLKTLSVRMRAHQSNATTMAKWLAQHPKVEKVIYPGLENHPQHALAKTQMLGFGGMLSFYVKGGLREAKHVLENVKIFTLAESLGGVESLIEHPALMTHASLPAELRAANGISDNFIRLSCGLEDIEDLKNDLNQAMNF